MKRSQPTVDRAVSLGEKFKRISERHNERRANIEERLVTSVEDHCLKLMRKACGRTDWPFKLPSDLSHVSKDVRYQLPFAAEALIEIRLYRQALERNDLASQRVHILHVSNLEPHFTKLGHFVRIGQSVEKGLRPRKPDPLSALMEKILRSRRSQGRRPTWMEVLSSLEDFDDPTDRVVESIDWEAELIEWSSNGRVKTTGFPAFRNRLTHLKNKIFGK